MHQFPLEGEWMNFIQNLISLTQYLKEAECQSGKGWGQDFLKNYVLQYVDSTASD